MHFPAPDDLIFLAAVLIAAYGVVEAHHFDFFLLLDLKLKLSLVAAILKALLLCDVNMTATIIAHGCGIHLKLRLKHLQQQLLSRP